MSVVVRIPSGEIKLLCKGAVSDRLTFIITKSIKLNIQMSFYKCQNYFMLKCQARILVFLFCQNTRYMYMYIMKFVR